MKNLLKKLFKKWNGLLKPYDIISNSSVKLKLDDEVDLQMEDGTIEKVTVVEITPHTTVKNSVYYKFSNGIVCRDIRLHPIPETINKKGEVKNGKKSKSSF